MIFSKIRTKHHFPKIKTKRHFSKIRTKCHFPKIRTKVMFPQSQDKNDVPQKSEWGHHFPKMAFLKIRTGPDGTGQVRTGEIQKSKNQQKLLSGKMRHLKYEKCHQGLEMVDLVHHFRVWCSSIPGAVGWSYWY